MNKKVAFICPLYDMKNHFDLAFNLYKSKIDLGITEELIFVFSDNIQKEKFRKRIKDSFNIEIAYLILPQEELHFKSKVTVKKIYALRSLMYDYDYLALVDSESIFIKKENFYELFEEIWDTGTFLNCNISPDGFFIQRDCFRTLSKKIYNNKIIRSEFDDFRYNLWFNEIPVYKCSTLPSFMKWLDSFDKNGWMNKWNCFDYYMYVAYLVLYENKHLIKHPDIISNGGVMEYLFERPISEQVDIINKLGTHWSSNKCAINDNICMLFHLDREKGEGKYSFALDQDKMKEFDEERNMLLRRDALVDKYPVMTLLFKVKEVYYKMKRKLFSPRRIHF